MILKATKESLYGLVAGNWKQPPPPIEETTFWEESQSNNFRLQWEVGGVTIQMLLTIALGTPVLAEKIRSNGRWQNRDFHELSLEDLWRFDLMDIGGGDSDSN